VNDRRPQQQQQQQGSGSGGGGIICRRLPVLGQPQRGRVGGLIIATVRPGGGH